MNRRDFLKGLGAVALGAVSQSAEARSPSADEPLDAEQENEMTDAYREQIENQLYEVEAFRTYVALTKLYKQENPLALSAEMLEKIDALGIDVGDDVVLHLSVPEEIHPNGKILVHMVDEYAKKISVGVEPGMNYKIFRSRVSAAIKVILDLHEKDGSQ